MRRSTLESALATAAAPDPDRARGLANVLALEANSAAWALLRCGPDGLPAEYIRDERLIERAPLNADTLKTEVALQAHQGVKAPAVRPTRIEITPYRYGLTALYGSRKRLAGVMVLLRHSSDGPFAREDARRLEESLGDASEAFGRLSIFEGEQAVAARVAKRSFPAQFILNRNMEVEACWRSDVADEDGDVLSTMLAVHDHQLPPALERAVRDVVAKWTDDPATWREAAVIPLPFVVVRVVPLAGARGLQIGVLIERYRARNALRSAIQRFGLSQREVQVLTLLLDGSGTTEAAAALGIAESTVNDHIKRLLVKTQAVNRVALAAKVLGWHVT